LTALDDGRPRLLLLGPLDELERGHREGVETVPIACASEGAMEVYVEPVLPAPEILAIGRTPAVDTLLGMAQVIGWRVALLEDPGGLRADGRTAVVVATQGHDDERALEAALRTEAGYVGLVASRPRARAVVDYLRARGVAQSDLARVRAPAGLDLGPTGPDEIGVAILAELVALRAAGKFGLVSRESGGAGVATVSDPVCGMTVTPSPTQYRREHAGRVWYFCSSDCRRRFEEAPERYGGSATAKER
jgi:xanthine dehydrogenase accessory factor